MADITAQGSGAALNLPFLSTPNNDIVASFGNPAGMGYVVVIDQGSIIHENDGSANSFGNPGTLAALNAAVIGSIEGP